MPYNGYVAHLRNPLKEFWQEYQSSAPGSSDFGSLKRDFGGVVIRPGVSRRIRVDLRGGEFRPRQT